MNALACAIPLVALGVFVAVVLVWVLRTTPEQINVSNPRNQGQWNRWHK